FN
ncbi:hypothetical protein ACTFIV_011319, partial [Dictyostelium citrinum]